MRASCHTAGDSEPSYSIEGAGYDDVMISAIFAALLVVASVADGDTLTLRADADDGPSSITIRLAERREFELGGECN